VTQVFAAARDFRRVLIANRGEIAIRIARAARGAGLIPLGVYSEADAGAAHLGAMDDALCIGPGPAAQSYLDIAAVLRAARELGADGVHPGYGFLSERAAFARAVRDAGLIFVGPSSEAIAAMGDKSEAKRRVQERDVPVVPGYAGGEREPEFLREQARRIGTPVVVKATAGGGGRGMRIASDLSHFDEAVEAARREAAAAFGDDAVLLERYIERPRHIEFQILADVYGKTIHLGERECSIQRRHQKLVEESPSVALDDALRERMGAAAIRAAQAVAYSNAGTVEFLLAPDGAFYFLEMNARLQVEHPVTELVHGVDLVRWQFALAAGAELTLQQADVRARGWAVEVRLNAEDPDNAYLPATGRITRFDPPAGPGLRLDAGVVAGSEIGIFYDSLLAKIIAHGATRREAIERLTHGLQTLRIEGVPTNLRLLESIAREPDFRHGATTTAYLAEHPRVLAGNDVRVPDTAALLAIGALLNDSRAWRVARIGIPLRLRTAGRTVEVVASRSGAGHGHYRLRGTFDLDATFEVAGQRIVLSAQGDRRAGSARIDATGVTLDFEGNTYRFELAPPPALGTGDGRQLTARGTIASPMPGKIVTVAVRPGDVVAERDLLVVLEAMKMEHRIEATHAGTVRSVTTAPGAVVQSGAALVEIEA